MSYAGNVAVTLAPDAALQAFRISRQQACPPVPVFVEITALECLVRAVLGPPGAPGTGTAAAAAAAPAGAAGAAKPQPGPSRARSGPVVRIPLRSIWAVSVEQQHPEFSRYLGVVAAVQEPAPPGRQPQVAGPKSQHRCHIFVCESDDTARQVAGSFKQAFTVLFSAASQQQHSTPLGSGTATGTDPNPIPYHLDQMALSTPIGQQSRQQPRMSSGHRRSRVEEMQKRLSDRMSGLIGDRPELCASSSHQPQ